MLSLSRTIDDVASRRPDGIAFLTDEESFTWASYASGSDRLAGLLHDLGLARGERVAILLPDGPGIHVAFVATEKAGLVAVGIGPRAGRKEIEHLLRVSGAAALISPRRHRDLELVEFANDWRKQGHPLRHHITVDGELRLDQAIAVDGEPATPPRADGALRGWIEKRRLGVEELWLLNSTSGTTGMPKCVKHHQARWMHFHRLAVAAADLNESDVFASAIPAPFGFGLWTAHFTPTLLGAPTVISAQFDPDRTLAALERHRVTVLAAVSTQFMMLLDSSALASRNLQNLRVLFTGGEKVPYRRAAEFEERTGAHVLQFYGSNETGALSGTSVRDSRKKRLTTAGRVIESMQVRLFDADGKDVTGSGRGQPGCKGGTLSLGYFGDEEANRELIRDDGWFLVGDLVQVDSEGYLTVEGRVGDFIIRGGKNISAPGVEEACEGHPDIRRAAAVAMPDATFGERVCVYVELRPGASLDLDGLLGHLLAEGASKETLPERLVVLDEIPRSSGGKIAKQVLREDATRYGS